TCHLGLFEFNVMPFGLKNAPPTFQRMMNEILKDWLDEFVVVYIDDIMIYSKTFEEHLEHIEKILKKLKEVNLMLKLSKCKWRESQQKAFEELKEKLIQYPILSYPDYEKEFILITDASGRGLGAVLSQLNDKGKEIVIAYASRSLVQAEKNYPITDQECLAIMWAIEHFHKYLIGKKFMIITDHNELKTLKTAKIQTKERRERWIMELKQYDIEIKQKRG